MVVSNENNHGDNGDSGIGSPPGPEIGGGSIVSNYDG